MAKSSRVPAMMALVLAAGAGAALVGSTLLAREQDPSSYQPPKSDKPMNPTFDAALAITGHSMPPAEVKLEKAMFGAGCFWGVEATFRQTPGVAGTAVGYAGGSTKNPSYKEVCGSATGHAEVVLVQFDPSKISYDEVLDIFWENHNPTTMNRQGPDVGTQYRSVIYAFDETQKNAAEKSKERASASGKWAGKKIVTFIEPAPAFYKGEDYHQQYLEKRGQTSCHIPE